MTIVLVVDPYKLIKQAAVNVPWLIILNTLVFDLIFDELKPLKVPVALRLNVPPLCISNVNDSFANVNKLICPKHSRLPLIIMPFDLDWNFTLTPNYI